MQLARALVAAGVGKGQPRRPADGEQPDWVAFAFAATGLGALLVPISTFSKPDDLAYQLRHADVEHLFLSARFLKNDYLGMLRSLVPELDDGRSWHVVQRNCSGAAPRGRARRRQAPARLHELRGLRGGPARGPRGDSAGVARRGRPRGRLLPAVHLGHDGAPQGRAPRTRSSVARTAGASASIRGWSPKTWSGSTTRSSSQRAAST